MPRILKKQNLKIASPLILQVNEFKKTVTKKEEPTDVLKKVVLQVAREKENIEVIQQESDKIIQETEAYVNEMLTQVRAEARDIIDLARQEAEQLKSAAVEETQKLKEQGFQEGLDQGLTQGLEEMQAKMEKEYHSAVEEKERIINAALTEKMQIIRSAEDDIVKLVMAVARKIISSELETRPELVLNIVREAIDYIDNPENVMIYVNPHDLATLTDNLEKIKMETFSNKDLDIKIKPENQIQQGGCIVESNNTFIDAGIENRINNMEKNLEDNTYK